VFPKKEIDSFEKYWQRRKPGSSTAVHYTSDVRIFFNWARGEPPEAITVHHALFHPTDTTLTWAVACRGMQATK
jgi:hypothetical protein